MIGEKFEDFWAELDVKKILEQLKIEREKRYKNGIYYLTQVEPAYNSNRIEFGGD